MTTRVTEGVVFTDRSKNGVGTQSDGRRSLFYLVYLVSVDFFMLSRHIWLAFLTLIPPTFTYRSPFETLLRPLQPHSSSHNWGKYENSRFNSDPSGYLWEMQSRETSRAHEIKSP